MISSWYFLIIIFSVWNAVCFCQISPVMWNQFATSQHYENLRLVTSGNFVTRLYVPKIWAQMECVKLCFFNKTCKAFNFYKIDTAFVCELVSDNLCINTTQRAFVSWPGSTVWDRLPTGLTKTCFDSRFPTLANVACEYLRPGCLGIWPNCYECTKTCIDCKSRYNMSGSGLCTMWPEGDTQWSVPIFGRCYGSNTYLLLRVVDSATGRTDDDYRMSFPDINRLYKLRAYSQMKFFFYGTTSTKSQYANVYYKNSYVNADGTLMNLTWSRSWPTNVPDIFNLNQKVLLPTPFIEVTDDRYNCGSFWLLDPQNATYCPGGKIAMFGTPTFINGTLNSTGIHCPAFEPGTLTVVSTMEFE